MNENMIKKLMELVRDGEKTVDEAIKELKFLPYEDIGYAKIDNHRSLRVGYPEVIYSEGKTFEQIQGIIEHMNSNDSVDILLTRLNKQIFIKLHEKFGELEYNEIARLGMIRKTKGESIGNIVVATGGTSDIPIAEEAALTAEFFGNKVDRIYDVGVAGIHRLLSNYHRIHEAKVIVAVAGMDGALPSAIAGLASVPVIAVPTSVGYGASFGGVAALLTMLNSCATGVSVVNIDNGFGAGYLASIINKGSNS